jgi:hypothetical protein
LYSDAWLHAEKEVEARAIKSVKNPDKNLSWLAPQVKLAFSQAGFHWLMVKAEQV